LVGCFGLLSGACGEDVATYAPPPESPAVFQNIHYTTNVYNGQSPLPVVALTPPPAVIPPKAPPPTPTGVSIIELPPSPPSHTQEVLPRVVKPVGIASCDAYLTHVEVCSRRMLSKLSTKVPSYDSDTAIAKVVMSLDMSRRAWRNTIPDMTARQRASLAETCSDSIRLYDMGAAESCAE